MMDWERDQVLMMGLGTRPGIDDGLRDQVLMLGWAAY